jgi:tetratricopeptide (TPR) repeat protein
MKRLARLTRDSGSERARLAMDLCSGRYDRVIEALKTGPAPDFADRDAYLAIAYSELAARDEERVTDLLAAVEHAARAAELRPESVRAQANHAVALESLALYDSALAAWRRALELAPDASPARLAVEKRLAALEGTLAEVRAADLALASLDGLQGKNVRELARRVPDLVFRLFEEQYLPRWAAAHARAAEGATEASVEEIAGLEVIAKDLAAVIAERGDSTLAEEM